MTQQTTQELTDHIRSIVSRHIERKVAPLMKLAKEKGASLGEIARTQGYAYPSAICKVLERYNKHQQEEALTKKDARKRPERGQNDETIPTK